jgi:hypothetical protein
MVQYDRVAARVNLLNDAGSAWAAGTLGTSSTLQNSQCSVAMATSSVALSGNTLTLNLALTFKPAYAGAKNVYLYAANGTGANSGWQDLGDWTVPAGGVTVTANSVTPNAGTGLSATFSALYVNTAGASDFATVWARFSSQPTGATNTCLVYYDRAASRINLLNAAGNVWMTGTLGQAGTLSNGYCSIALASSSVSLNGTWLTLNLAMTFNSQFYWGLKNIYLYGASVSGANSGWQHRGTWTVP